MDGEQDQVEVEARLDLLERQLASIRQFQCSTARPEEAEQLRGLLSGATETMRALASVLRVRAGRGVALVCSPEPPDPSIEFFGLDWAGLGGRLGRLRAECGAEQAGRGLELLLGLQEELQLHSRALQAGRLGSRAAREQEVRQRRLALLAPNREAAPQAERASTEQYLLITRLQALVNYVGNKLKLQT